MKDESEKPLREDQLKERMKLINVETYSAWLVQKIDEMRIYFQNLQSRRTLNFEPYSRSLSVFIKDLCPFDRIHIRTGKQYLIVNPNAQLKLPDSRWVPAIIYTDGENYEKTNNPNREWIRLADDFNKKFSEVKL